jgi:hypothetical protein
MRMREFDERLDKLNSYCREMNIELYGGNDVVKAFEKLWALAFYLNLDRVSFNCNGKKVTIESVKS